MRMNPNVLLWHKLIGNRSVIEFGLNKEVEVGGMVSIKRDWHQNEIKAS